MILIFVFPIFTIRLQPVNTRQVMCMHWSLVLTSKGTILEDNKLPSCSYSAVHQYAL